MRFWVLLGERPTLTNDENNERNADGGDENDSCRGEALAALQLASITCERQTHDEQIFTFSHVKATLKADESVS